MTSDPKHWKCAPEKLALICPFNVPRQGGPVLGWALGSTVANKPIWGVKGLAIEGSQHLTTANVTQKLVNGLAGTEICSGASTGQDASHAPLRAFICVISCDPGSGLARRPSPWPGGCVGWSVPLHCTRRACTFHSRSGHTLRFGVQFPVGARAWEATYRVFLSPPSSL